MLYSMTGYGRISNDIPQKKITIEIKTLNSKQFDVNMRMPPYYRKKEIEVRNLLAGKLERGKIDFSMFVELIGETSNNSINTEIYKGYYKQLKDIYNDLNSELPPQALTEILRLPDVVSASYDDLDDDEWANIKDFIEQAVDACVAHRKNEGAALEKDILTRIDNIELLVEEVLPFESQRIKTIKDKIQSALEANVESENIDSNRFEQELIYYLEKLDVNEEIVRLKNHCKYFRDTVSKGGVLGKKLGFISQEIGREINTLGSKANESNMQRIVVQMKDELEKIKEQSLNVL